MKHRLLFFCVWMYVFSGRIVYAGVVPPDNAGIDDLLNRLPIHFRENKGQWDERILFQGSSPGWDANVYFLKNAVSFGFRKVVEQNAGKKKPHREDISYMTWNLHFSNANPDVRINANGKEDSYNNYLLGNDVSRHVINVPDYRMLTYQDIYKGIDVRYYSTGKELKYDFLLKPGANADNIQLSCEGIKKLTINNRNQLEIHTPWGILLEELPESYQIINGEKIQRTVSYQLLNDTTFGFKIAGDYDHEVELVIDPVNLVWSTFVGGTSPTGNGYLYDIAVDAAGNVYGTGYYGTSYPITPGGTPFHTSPTPGNDVYIFKLKPDATGLVYATYLGGRGDEYGMGITVNTLGEAFVTGFTSRAGATPNDFYTTAGVVSATPKGGMDIFVTRLNATGTGAIYSTYLGGTGTDEGHGIAVNANNEAFISGFTSSSATFTTTAGAFQTAYGGGMSDGFIVKLNPTGTTLAYSTFLGGGADESTIADLSICELVINATDDVFVAGTTTSGNFPVTIGGGYKGGSNDVYVVRMKLAGAGAADMVWGTFFGGNSRDYGRGIAVNSSDEVYVTGNTASNNLPVTTGGGYQGGGFDGDAFVVKFNATGSIIYARYLGGSADEDFGTGIAASWNGDAFVTGYTGSANFPVTTCVVQNTNHGDKDFFFTVLSNTGAIQYSTFFGGWTNEYYIPKVVVTGSCDNEEAVLGGTIHSSDYRTTPGVWQETKRNNASNDKFDQPGVWKLKPTIKAGFKFTVSACNQPVVFTDTTNQCGLWRPLQNWLWKFGDGTTSTTQHPTHLYASPGTYTVTMIVSCPTDSFKSTVTITDPFTPLDLGPDVSSCIANGPVMLDAGVHAGVTYLWNTAQTTQSITTLTSGKYWVTMSNGTCSKSDTIQVNFVNQLQADIRDTLLCGVPSFTLDAGNPGNVYTWSTGATTQTISVNTSTKYWVRIGAGACSASDTAVITFLTPPVVNLRNDTTVCAGVQLVVDAGNSGNVYVWNDNSTSQTIATGSTGIYWVRVGPAVCAASDTFKLNVVDIPVVSMNDTALCVGQTLTLDAGLHAACTYSWNDASTNQTLQVNASNTYWVRVDNGTCATTDTVKVIFAALPAVDIGNDTTFCEGGVLLLSASNPGNVYMWSTGVTTQTIDVAVTGQYWVKVGAVGCSSADTVNVTVITYPVISINDTSVCGDTPVMLNIASNAAYSYLWSSGSTESTIEVSVNGQYWVKVSNAVCSVSDTTNVQFLPVPVVNLGNDTSICPGASIKIDAGNAGSVYEWSNGTTTQLITVDKPGIYSVQVDNSGCRGLGKIVITQPDPIEIGPDVSLCETPDAIIDAGPGQSYLWSNGSTTQTVKPDSAGNYWVSVTKGVCKFYDTVRVTGDGLGTFLFVPNAFTPNQDTRNETFMAYGSGVTGFNMQLFDRWGNLYFESNDINKGWDGKLNGSLVQQDVYIWIIEYKNTCSPDKMISRLGHVSVIR